MPPKKTVGKRSGAVHTATRRRGEKATKAAVSAQSSKTPPRALPGTTYSGDLRDRAVRSQARPRSRASAGAHVHLDALVRELETQNEKLCKSHAALDETVERYRDLYDFAPIGYLTLDRNGVIVEANRTAGEYLGTERVRLTSQHLDKFVESRDERALRKHLRQVFAAETPQACELRAVHRGSEQTWIAVRSTREEHRAGRKILCRTVLMDISARKHAELALRESREELEGRLRARTSELKRANESLRHELDARKHAEKELRTSQAKIRELASQAALAEQRERKRLASDLHDGLGQIVTLAAIRLNAVEGASAAEAAEIREVRGLLVQAQGLAESLMFQLSPPVLHDVGLVAACQWLADEIARTYSFEVRVDADCEHRWEDEAVSATVFRAVREFLINAAQHSRARRATISFRIEEPNLVITVVDGGVGFEASTVRGFGLSNAAERLRYLGSDVEIVSAPRRGTRIRVLVPLEMGWGATGEEPA